MSVTLENGRSADPALEMFGSDGLVDFETKVEIEKKNVYIFDFDGVISSSVEDQTYRCSSSQDEMALTEYAANVFGLRCDGYEYRYKRHLVHQAALWRLGVPIEPGPAFAEAKAASVLARTFVLTARSSWFAVERCREFLKYHDIKPLEIFNVGRVGKTAQVSYICNEFAPTTVTFVEDSAAHLLAAIRSEIPNLKTVLISERAENKIEPEILLQNYAEIVMSAIRSEI